MFQVNVDTMSTALERCLTRANREVQGETDEFDRTRARESLKKFCNMMNLVYNSVEQRKEKHEQDNCKSMAGIGGTDQSGDRADGLNQGQQRTGGIVKEPESSAGKK